MGAEFDWKSLEDPIEARPAKARETFPCGECGGSGQYRGPRVHQHKSHCFACGGRGWFYTSYADRMKKRQQAQQQKAAQADRIRSDLNALHPGLLDWMAENRHWCGFAGQLLDQMGKGREISERQVEAIIRTRAKVAERRAEKVAAREAAQVKIDLAPVRAMFEAATGAGLKSPQFRAAGLTLSLAKPNSRNPGAIYVKRSGEYLGKVDGIVFKPVSGGESAAATLLEIAVDPKAAAVAYGRETGVCACCGRTLTDPESVAAGIGPICAGKWGF